jgi:hypothetical protein
VTAKSSNQLGANALGEKTASAILLAFSLSLETPRAMPLQ